ncbi:MAG: phosphotransferase family protein [Bacilli bacterium]
MTSALPEGLQTWLADHGWTALHCVRLTGGFSASLFALCARSQSGAERNLIYKRFAPGRADELHVYSQLLPKLGGYAPDALAFIHTLGEQGILMDHAGTPVKSVLLLKDRAGRRAILTAAITWLADLHVRFAEHSQSWLHAGIIGLYPFQSSLAYAQEALQALTWLTEPQSPRPQQQLQNGRFASRTSSAEPTETGPTGTGTPRTELPCAELPGGQAAPLRPGSVVDASVVSEIGAMMAWFYPRYPGFMDGRTTITHGDPHLENLLFQHGRFCLIDWEYTAVAVPSRDLAILLQDVLEDDMRHSLRTVYWDRLRQNGWRVDDDAFEIGYQACLFDNTLMMLGWEVSKYRNGHLNQPELEVIVATKLRWLRECFRRLL